MLSIYKSLHCIYCHICYSKPCNINPYIEAEIEKYSYHFSVPPNGAKAAGALYCFLTTALLCVQYAAGALSSSLFSCRGIEQKSCQIEAVQLRRYQFTTNSEQLFCLRHLSWASLVLIFFIMATATVTSGSGSNVGIQTLEHLLFKATSPRFVPHVQLE